MHRATAYVHRNDDDEDNDVGYVRISGDTDRGIDKRTSVKLLRELPRGPHAYSPPTFKDTWHLLLRTRGTYFLGHVATPSARLSYMGALPFALRPPEGRAQAIHWHIGNTQRFFYS